MSTCRSCGEPITWAITANGKRMPLDAEPSMEGNVVLTRAEPGETPIARVLAGDALAEARLAAVPLHLLHHVTCPHGRAWRRR